MKNEQLNPVHKAIVDCIFGGNAGECDSIAVEGVIHNLQNPTDMTKEVYLRLQELKEGMEMAAAKGHDCIDGFDERLAEVGRLMDAAPWIMCPDDGCIPWINKPQGASRPGV